MSTGVDEGLGEPGFCSGFEHHAVFALWFVGENAGLDADVEELEELWEVEEALETVQMYVPGVMHGVVVGVAIAELVEGDSVMTLVDEVRLAWTGFESAPRAEFGVWIAEF